MDGWNNIWINGCNNRWMEQSYKKSTNDTVIDTCGVLSLCTSMLMTN